MKLLLKYLPILDWGSKYCIRTFGVLVAAGIFAKRAGDDAMGGAA